MTKGGMRSKGTVAHGKRLIRAAGKRRRDLFDCVVASSIDPDTAKRSRVYVEDRGLYHGMGQF
jgi:hypothetical protein